MTDFVVDASVGLKWIVDEPLGDVARGILRLALAVPDFFDIECANVVWGWVRRGNLSRAEALLRLQWIEQTPIARHPIGDLTTPATHLALDLDHPVYDCVYLALAIRMNIPVITADRRFIHALARHGGLAARGRWLGDMRE
mgnify:FL=1